MLSTFLSQGLRPMRARCAAVLVVVLGAGALPSVALADDPPEVVQARQDFRDGVSLMAAEDWTNALAKFQKVARVKVNAQVAFNMAECEEHLNQWVSALGNYRLAASKSQDGSAPDVAAHVDERIASLEKRMPHLTITRKETTPNPKAHIELDGVEVPSTEIGKPMAADPGERIVTVVIGGKTATTRKIVLGEGKSETAAMTIPEPEKSDGKSPDGVVIDTPPPATGPSIPGIVVTTLGGAAAVVGVVFVGLRQKAIGDLDTLCGGDSSCPATAKPTYDDGRTFTGVAEVMIPVGVVGLTTGIILIATHHKKAPASDAPKTSAGLTWSLVPGAPGADLGGLGFASAF